MKKHFFRTRKAQYGGVTALLTVLVIVVTLLANAVFGTLAARYGWHTSMTAVGNYDVSDTCYALLDEILDEGSQKNVEILFCDTYQNVVDDGTLSYVYETASSLAERYPDRLSVSCHDIMTNPNTVRQYATAQNLQTGETQEIPIYETSVILASEDYHRVYNLEDFFVFEGGNASNVWAYKGERKLVAGILHAVDEQAPTVCLTNNHGEVFYDYELLYLLDDAGYRISYIDLYEDEIPDSCNLIISYNPNTDLVADSLSEKSEIEILDAFLERDGNNFLVFVENGTPKLPNFESYLADWGFAFQYFTDVNTGNSYRYMVQNNTQSLTSDGYTIYGEPITSGRSGELLDGLTRKTVFRNSTAMVAAKGFVNNGDGSFTKGDRTLYSLYESGEGTVSWAHGAAVASGSTMLMGVSEQNTNGRVCRVGVVSSVRFLTEEYLQSAVYGNSDLSMRLFGTLGKDFVPEGLTIKPFSSLEISTVTTAQMVQWTLWLTLTPTVAVTAIALIVLIRRRRA